MHGVTPIARDANINVVGLVALCYHKVGTELAEGRRLNIHPARLDTHVRHFLRRGYRFIRACEADLQGSDQTVCFTFDDGFVSTLENGAPVFDRHRVPMTVYVVSELVGKLSDWAGEVPRPLADWDALASLQKRGHEIGNHSATHPRFAQLDFEQQVSEIRNCQQAMVARGLRSESFCYPYGSMSDMSAKAVTACGYRVGMALGKRSATISDSLLRIPRIVVAYGDALPMLLYKLHLKPLIPRFGKS